MISEQTQDLHNLTNLCNGTRIEKHCKRQSHYCNRGLPLYEVLAQWLFTKHIHQITQTAAVTTDAKTPPWVILSLQWDQEQSIPS